MDQRGTGDSGWRRGEEPSRHGGRHRSNSDPDADLGDVVYGQDGRVLRDRFGRPVRRRPAAERRDRPERPDRSRDTRKDRERELREREARARHEQPRAFGRRDDVNLRSRGYRRPDERTPRDPDRPRQYIPTPEEQARREREDRYARRQADAYRARERAAYREVEPGPDRPRPRRRRPGYADAQPKRRRQFRMPRMPRVGCGGCLGRILAVVLVLAVVTTLWADTRLNRVEAKPEQRVANTAGTNWLLVGSDSRQGLSEEDIARLGTGGDVGVGRTDTVMLLHIPTTGKAKLISLPRDSYVSVPGYGMDKLNASFTYGGPQLLTETVEQATGLRIDHYAEIGMGGLANTVDAVGGVTVCPEEPITDPLANLDIAAGCQRVDGATALGYVRTRATANGDLDRVARQREFFAALLDKVTSPATLINPLRSIPMLNRVTGSFTVGEGDHVWHLARVALAMRGVETETVPVGGFADYDVGNVVLWDEAGANALFDSIS
ncbi:LCP family protein [Corynebacterium frankenforstense]|uniref:LCP family protein n=1 Tax=Corynebacterium TaxID=1716 RepID=UPI00254B0AA3|nr:MULTISPECIES: LCP family protein [Corynebacterium]MDK6259433.1 LCP family protein [Corynebacterium frankenforstense]MDK8895141.1 LCP family protein [Corynebacterium sp. MSK006]